MGDGFNRSKDPSLH